MEEGEREGGRNKKETLTARCPEAKRRACGSVRYCAYAANPSALNTTSVSSVSVSIAVIPLFP